MLRAWFLHRLVKDRGDMGELSAQALAFARDGDGIAGGPRSS